MVRYSRRMKLDGPGIETIRTSKRPRLSREKLARLADTSTRTIVRIEREGADPGASIVARIAVALGVPIDSLFINEPPAAEPEQAA